MFYANPTIQYNVLNSAFDLRPSIAISEDNKSYSKTGKSVRLADAQRYVSEYVEDGDFIFIILSIKHRVYSTRDEKTKMMKGIMEVVASHTYDLKYLSDSDISYNPALGTGQIQVRDIHYVTLVDRTVAEFCMLLDRKFLASNKGYDQWLKYALQNNWIK